MPPMESELSLGDVTMPRPQTLNMCKGLESSSPFICHMPLSTAHEHDVMTHSNQAQQWQYSQGIEAEPASRDGVELRTRHSCHDDVHSRYHRWSRYPPCRVLPMLGWKREFSHVDTFLFSFFEQVICSSTMVIDDRHHNPLRSIVLPLSLSDKINYYAVLMISAQSLSRLDSRFHAVELQLRQVLLTTLRHTLGESGWGAEDILLPVMLLCASEVRRCFLIPI